MPPEGDNGSTRTERKLVRLGQMELTEALKRHERYVNRQSGGRRLVLEVHDLS
jgi:hypothetical protein